MSRPRFFRDPVHEQIRYQRIDAPGSDRARADEGRLMQALIDRPEFQRLRHISALRDTRYFKRLIIPSEIRDELRDYAKEKHIR